LLQNPSCAFSLFVLFHWGETQSELAKNGKVLFSGAYGMADRERKTPNTLDTKFRIGSLAGMSLSSVWANAEDSAR
jgi:hypothetical protein